MKLYWSETNTNNLCPDVAVSYATLMVLEIRFESESEFLEAVINLSNDADMKLFYSNLSKCVPDATHIQLKIAYKNAIKCWMADNYDSFIETFHLRCHLSEGARHINKTNESREILESIFIVLFNFYPGNEFVKWISNEIDISEKITFESIFNKLIELRYAPIKALELTKRLLIVFA